MARLICNQPARKQDFLDKAREELEGVSEAQEGALEARKAVARIRVRAKEIEREMEDG